MIKNKRVFFGFITAALLLFSAEAAVWSVNELSHQDQITEVQAAESNYWSGLDTSGNTYGNSFRSAIKTIIDQKSSKTNSYSALNSILSSSDYASSGKIHPFYRAPSESSSSWNKEHVWPNSRGAGENAGYAGTDPQVIRPTNSADNSSRSNYMYGETSSPSWSTGWDPISISGYSSARGEAARIIFYAATRYYNKSTSGAGGSAGSSGAPLELSDVFDNCSSGSSHKMGKLSYLMKWNDEYPVTAEEVYRNEYLVGQGYARNPFIDHPNWANYIWSVNTMDNGGGTSSNNYTRTVSYSSVTSSSQDSSAPSSSTSESSSSTISSSSSSSATSSSSSGSSSSIIASSSASPDSLYAAVKETSDIITTPTRLVSIVGKGSGDDYHALKPAMINTYYVDQTPVSMSNGSMVFTDGVGTFQVEASSQNQGFYTLKDAGTTAMGYLSGTVSGSHYNLGFESAESQNSQWDITIAANGTMALKSASGVYAKYDSNFSDFTGSSASADLFAFKKKAAVVAVTSLSLNFENLTLKVNDSATLVATVNPENAANTNVSWSSSDETIASVDQTGVVLAHKAGEATITVTSADGGKTASCLVRVNEENPENPGGGSFPTWAIIVIVIGGSLIGIGLAVLATLLVLRSRKKKNVA